MLQHNSSPMLVLPFIMRSLTRFLVILALVALSWFPVATGEPRVDLGLVKPYAILAGATVHSSDQEGTEVTGDIGIFPGHELTGFPPAVHHGDVDAANTAAEDAQTALTAAYNDAESRECNVSLDSNFGNMTLLPGVYKFDQTAFLCGNLTLDADGDAAAVWIFQVHSSFHVAEDSFVDFQDGVGNPDYVYWKVGASANIAGGVAMVGNIMAQAAINIDDGTSIRGRVLTLHAAVNLDNNVITRPSTAAFRAVQNVKGLNADQYNERAEVNEATLKRAIAECMTGVLPEDIYSFEVSEGPTTETETPSLRTVIARRTQETTDSIILNYDVIVSSTMTSEELQEQLRAAVEDGTFDSNLHAAAADNGATDLSDASSDSIRTETIREEDGSDKKTLTTGGIIGIAIGGFVGLVLISMIIYFFACHAPVHQATAVPNKA